MQLGMIGLGRMGANLVRRLMRDGHTCVVFDTNQDAVKELEAEGAIGATSMADLVAKMERPRAEAMMRAIIGYELSPAAIGTTLKASQNRSEADAAGVTAALERLGETEGAARIRAARKTS
jgi:6-phosphogluconate dehydrogenase (decarboxylating)